MLPEETVQACINLNAKVLMPVHWGKFSISLHAWDEPIKRVYAEANKLNVKITTPQIGEPVITGSFYPDKTWWLL
jgi:L-ascorbate metabolism protein UlaG (beta-lactamase superfamily)